MYTVHMPVFLMKQLFGLFLTVHVKGGRQLADRSRTVIAQCLVFKRLTVDNGGLYHVDFFAFFLFL